MKVNLKNKRVLVTGGGGFIGSHLVERLVKSSRQVGVFLRYNSKSSRGFIDSFSQDIQDSLTVWWGDLKDPEAVRSAVKDADVVFHLAALIAIPYSYLNPSDYVQTNVVGTTNVLNACREFGIDKLIHTSTSEVYGTALYKPIDEKHPLQGQSPYSASKIAADKMVESYFCSFSLPVVTVRPFNTFGPRQSARAVIPTIITQALTRDVVKLGSLFPSRDFTFVEDTVNGFVLAAETASSVGEVINLGSGKEVTVGDLAKMIIKMTKSGAKIVTVKNRIRPDQSEVKALIADCSKANKLLKWNQKVNLNQGLERTIDWIRENIGIYRAEAYNI